MTATVSRVDKPTFSERVVSRLANGVFAKRSSRRSFLTATALVGSAVTVDPWKFVTQPVSAYDAVCGPGNTCGEGWSVFCCTINNGANLCPSGSFVGGWWKADNSGFCCGAARYYVDCNAQCGSGWYCHCNTTTCDQRRVACNQFRYGQCNQQISCYGPVVCRVVTCTPPWQYDPSCTTASATDNNTVLHSAPCLPGNCPSAITMRYYDLGGPGGKLGAVIVSERSDPHGGTYARYQYGAIYSYGPTGTHDVRGPVYTKFHDLGGTGSYLGHPINNYGKAPDNVGVYQRFQGGSIYWSPSTDVHVVYFDIKDCWGSLGGSTGPLGYPTSDQLAGPGYGIYNTFQYGIVAQRLGAGAYGVYGACYVRYVADGGLGGPLGYPIASTRPVGDAARGLYSRFEHGTITSSNASGTWAVYGDVYPKWAQFAGVHGPLGYPTSDQGQVADGVGRYQRFQHGSIYAHPTHGVHALWGPVYDKWAQLGGSRSPLGYPDSDIKSINPSGSQYASFNNSTIAYSPATGAHAVYGPIWNTWAQNGGAGGKYGFPLTDVITDANGTQHVDFQHGTLTYTPGGGVVAS